MLGNYGRSGGISYKDIEKKLKKPEISQKGTKFDAGKSRFDLIEFKSYSKVMDMAKNVSNSDIKHMNKNDLSTRMSSQYMEMFKYIEERKHLIGLIGNIASLALLILDSKSEIETARLLGDLYGYGASMHGDNNWRKVEPFRFFAALGRHISDISRGEVADPESKLPHTIHILWNCITLIYFLERKDETKRQS